MIETTTLMVRTAKLAAFGLSTEAYAKLTASLLEFWRGLESEESRRGYAADWRRYCTWLRSGGHSPLNATVAHVQAYLLDMQGRNLARATRARALSVVRETYGALVRGGLLKDNPAREAKNIRVSKEPRTPWLTENELKRLIARPAKFTTWKSYRDWLIIITLVGTGLRRKEVAQLQIENLCLSPTGRPGCRVTVKGNKQGFILMPLWLYEHLWKWCRYLKRGRGPLFSSYQTAVQLRCVSPSTVRNIVKAAAARAGIDETRATPHAMRRTFITVTGERGAPLKDRQAALLHSHSSTTELYDKATGKTAPGDLLEDLVPRSKR